MGHQIDVQYITPKEIQDILKIGRNKAYKLCALKGFPAIRLGSTYRIDKKKFEKWLDENSGMQIFLE